MKITASRRLEWDSAHRVLRHESKCSTLHGHRYVAIIEVMADQLDHVGRVVDFGVIKSKVGAWIDDNWDHTTLVNAADTDLRDFCVADHVENGKRPCWSFNGEPTAENIAAMLLIQASHMLNEDGLMVTKVRVYETPNCYADAIA